MVYRGKPLKSHFFKVNKHEIEAHFSKHADSLFWGGIFGNADQYQHADFL